MSRAGFLSALLGLTSLAGCTSADPASNELAREDAERNALLEATQSRFEEAARNGSDLGKLPPLPGVDYPAPKSPENSAAESHHGHSTNPQENLADPHDQH